LGYYKYLATLVLTGSLSIYSTADNYNPYLYILGVAQDGGYPQAGCYQPHCMKGWEDGRFKRSAASLGLVDPVNNRKFIFEATPDFPQQLFNLEMEAPSAVYTLAGIFLTHAHIGHYAGLIFLGQEAMGTSHLPVYVMPRMSQFLKDNGPWRQLVSYNNIRLEPLQNQKNQNLGNLKITPFLVPHRDEYSETVGYRIEGPEKSAIFVPDINKWSDWQIKISDLVLTVDYALIDATFYADGELPGRDMSKIPHPFVTESMQLLKGLSHQERGKVWFIHMNHTNPLLDSNSQEHQKVRSEGYNVAVEGLRLDL